ncbi:MAG: creatininase family protein [Candidatus Aminicenantes bacterium]|nr:creatininase family protein [Candidatus Aminicenantes bacterium]
MRYSKTILFLIIIGLAVLSLVGADAPRGAFLGELTWPEAEVRLKEAPLVIVPFGAGAKEHGPHLPMNADAKVAEYLCQKAVAALPVVVVPPVRHGWFPAFRDYPGTEIADGDVFRRFIYEIAKSLIKNGAKRIVFLNTGIFKATGLPLAMVAREIRVEYRIPALVVSWDDLEDKEIEKLQEQKIGGHADEIETSIHLFLQPHLVQMEKAVPDYGKPVKKDYAGYRPGLFSRNPGDPAYSKTGLLGDPTKATAEKGKKALDIMTANFIKILAGFAASSCPTG